MFNNMVCLGELCLVQTLHVQFDWLWTTFSTSRERHKTTQTSTNILCKFHTHTFLLLAILIQDQKNYYYHFVMMSLYFVTKMKIHNTCNSHFVDCKLSDLGQKCRRIVTTICYLGENIVHFK